MNSILGGRDLLFTINNLSTSLINTKRLTKLMNRLTQKTVPGELLEPALEAWSQVRRPGADSRALGMDIFITLGVLRHPQGIRTLREQVQSLLRLLADTESRTPLACSKR